MGVLFESHAMKSCRSCGCEGCFFVDPRTESCRECRSLSIASTAFEFKFLMKFDKREDSKKSEWIDRSKIWSCISTFDMSDKWQRHTSLKR